MRVTMGDAMNANESDAEREAEPIQDMEDTQEPQEEDKEQEERIKFVLRAEFHVKSNSKSFSVGKAMTDLLQNILDNNNTAKLSIHNRDYSKGFSSMDKFPTATKEVEEFFDTAITKNGNQTTVVIATRIRSVQDFETLKNPEVKEFLRTEQIWIDEHKFESLEIKELGFFRGIHPDIVWRPLIAEKLRSQLELYLQKVHQETSKASGEIEDPEGQPAIPYFEVHKKNIYASTPSDRGGTDKLQTAALVIRCDSHHQKQLDKLLSDATGNRGFADIKYVPYALSAQDKNLYIEQIRRQNVVLDTVTAVKIYGMDPKVLSWEHEDVEGELTSINQTIYDAYYRYDDDNNKYPIFYSAEQTKTTPTDGKYLMVIERVNITTAKTWITDILQPQYEEMAEAYCQAHKTENTTTIKKKVSQQQHPIKYKQLDDALENHETHFPEMKHNKPHLRKKRKTNLELSFIVRNQQPSTKNTDQNKKNLTYSQVASGNKQQTQQVTANGDTKQEKQAEDTANFNKRWDKKEALINACTDAMVNDMMERTFKTLDQNALKMEEFMKQCTVREQKMQATIDQLVMIVTKLTSDRAEAAEIGQDAEEEQTQDSQEMEYSEEETKRAAKSKTYTRTMTGSINKENNMQAIKAKP